MRIVFTLIAYLIYSIVPAQNLKNTEWVKMRAQRKDGSKIIAHILANDQPIKYYFLGDSVFVSLDDQYSYKLKYTINNNILYIGDFIKYRINSITDDSLIVSDDKSKGSVFFNTKYLFEHLKKKQQLIITGDTLVQCNDEFSPSYTGNISEVFYSQSKIFKTNNTYSGSFIVLANGDIVNIVINETSKASNAEKEKITTIINSTKGSWIIPIIEKPLQFKIDFAFLFASIQTFSGCRFTFYPNNPGKILTFTEEAELNNHFNDGVKFFNKEKYEKAAAEFLKCLQLGPLNIDSHYNIALTYQKLGNTKMACESWQKLKEIGQEEGERLYTKYCQ